MTLIATGSKISSRDLIHAAKIAGKIPELIQDILRRQIIDRYIQELGIEITEAEVQVAADRFRLLNKLENVETTNQWLSANLLSLNDFEYIITYNLITNKLAQHLFADRVEKFFHQNLLDYSGAIVYEVVLADRNLAMELFYLIEEGDLRFADVAHQYITDPELRRRGGYLGKVGRKQLHPEISAAVFAAKPSQLIKPIVTDVGVHLIQVEEIFYPQKLAIRAVVI
jgi:parvulin-like peptidyl-prolyl isomerase